MNTLALSISEVEELIAASPWVEEVSVKRVLPDRLVVGIKERTPAFSALRRHHVLCGYPGRAYRSCGGGALYLPARPGSGEKARKTWRGACRPGSFLKEANLPLDLQDGLILTPLCVPRLEIM